MIQDLAEKSGVSSWPNVSLSGLQQFAAGLVNDVVRAGDHDVRWAISSTLLLTKKVMLSQQD